MKRLVYLLIYTIIFLIIILSSLYIVKYYYDIYRTKKESNILNEIYINETDNTNIKNTNIDKKNKQTKKNETERMAKLKKLQKDNKDVIGWIEIENTQINYPVVQGKDNEYYMTHNYKKQKSINGAIFLDKDYNFNIPSSNLLIYGHNMKNNTMFQYLLKYSDKEFYNKHPTIRFTTTKEDVNYEIIAVFKSRVYYKSEKNVFRYYYFINAKNEKQYNEYVQNAKKMSLYNINNTAKYKEQLMTLSTCSYHTKDGRFVVVAKKGKEYKE